MAVQHKSKISVEVGLDENKVPETLNWSAEDGGVTDQSAKAMMLSVWDHNAQESLRIDLWTKDMPVQEMRIFTAQVLEKLGDTFERATRNQDLGAMLRKFSAQFRVKIQEIEKKEKDMETN